MKTYTLFAGVNGAGKTSLYLGNYANLNPNEKRINTDEMVARIGSWQDENLQMKCAREAIKLINEYFKEGVSFNQETTLSGKSIIRNIKKAKENGYFVSLNFVSVENYKIAQERVAKRVLKGGHGIPNELVKKRYFESFQNLKNIINICDEIYIFDNTDTCQLVCFMTNGEIFSDKHIDKNKYNYIFDMLNID